MEPEKITRRGIGLAAAVGLSLLATYLFNLPEALEGFYRIIAVIGGLAGYWISSAKSLSQTGITSRIFIGIFAIFVSALVALYLRWYFDQSFTPLIHDGFALVAFGLSFASACFFMGLCGISLDTSNPNDKKS